MTNVYTYFPYVSPFPPLPPPPSLIYDCQLLLLLLFFVRTFTYTYMHNLIRLYYSCVRIVYPLNIIFDELLRVSSQQAWDGTSVQS